MISHEAEPESGQIRKIDWHGEPDEALSLLSALRAHCECKVDDGRTVFPCPGHYMLARDQKTIDGLLRMRREVQRLLVGEFDPDYSGQVNLSHVTLEHPQNVINNFQTPNQQT